MPALVGLVDRQHNVRDGGDEAGFTGGISCVGHQQKFLGLGHKVGVRNSVQSVPSRGTTPRYRG